MKKMLIFAPLVLLAACDNPKNIDLQCEISQVNLKLYRNSTKLIIDKKKGFEESFRGASKIADAMPLQINLDGKKVERYKAFGTSFTYHSSGGGYNTANAIARRMTVYKSTYIEFVGNIKNTNKTVHLNFSEYDANKKLLKGAVIEIKGSENNTLFLDRCFASVPYDRIIPPDNVAKLNSEEKEKIMECIDYIHKNVEITLDIDVNDNSKVTRFRIQNNIDDWTDISRESALELSKNWKFDDMKYYTNNDDGYVFEYEVDACEVMEKLKALQKRIEESKKK